MIGYPRRLALAGALCIAAALGPAACGNSDDQAPEGPVSLAIQNFAFKPATLDVPAGSRIRVTNQDSAAHTVTADDRSFDTGSIAAGAGAEVMAPQGGELSYHCNIHDYMRGVIRVRPQ